MHVIVETSGEANFHLCSNDPNDLVPLEPTSDDYRRIQNAFISSWKHPGYPQPKIKNICYVAHSSPDALAHLSRFSNYSNKVGNTQLLYHGTSRTCSVGSSTNPAHLKFCNKTNCSLCLILKGSYDIEKTRSRSMFGIGIYSTTVSSKAHGYASRNNPSLKTIILNHVVLGRSVLMMQHDHSLQHAPDIYNSVTGATVEQGGSVLYHEAIVYREDAMCASAVIFY
ncbi:ADP-ribosylation, partial [Coprinopsis marcescibilis]